MAREVFFADSTNVLSSNGHVVRGSMTSALMPISASNSAAPRATCTMLLVPTSVMSFPCRLISATPNGMVVLFGNRTFLLVHHFVFEKNNRIVVANRRFQQTLGVVWC